MKFVFLAVILSAVNGSTVPPTTPEPTMVPAHAKDPVRLVHGTAKPADPVYPAWANTMM